MALNFTSLTRWAGSGFTPPLPCSFQGDFFVGYIDDSIMIREAAVSYLNISMGAVLSQLNLWDIEGVTLSTLYRIKNSVSVCRIVTVKDYKYFSKA